MPDNNTALLIMAKGVLNQEITALLDGLGYQVTDTVAVSEVLEHLITNRYDLLVLGMTLPDLDWHDTVRSLRTTSNASRLMMITQNSRQGRPALGSKCWRLRRFGPSHHSSQTIGYDRAA
jgi:DNA-binding response OmpR family regulator